MWLTSMIDTIDEDELVVHIKERLIVEEITSIKMNSYNNNSDEYDEMESTFVCRGAYTYALSLLSAYASIMLIQVI